MKRCAEAGSNIYNEMIGRVTWICGTAGRLGGGMAAGRARGATVRGAGGAPPERRTQGGRPRRRLLDHPGAQALWLLHYDRALSP